MSELDIYWVWLMAAAFVVLAASMVKIVAGFGFGLTATPFLLLMFEPKLVVPVVLPLTLLLDLLVAFQTREHLDFKRVIPLLVGGSIGVVLGVFVLLLLPEEAIKVFISIVIIAFGFFLLRGYTINITRERLAGGLAGFFSGGLATSAGVVGPPMALFLVNMRVERDHFRHLISMFSAIVHMLGIITLVISGIVELKTVLLVALLLPGIVVGSLLASRIPNLIEPRVFRLIVIFIVIIASLAAMASALTALLT